MPQTNHNPKHLAEAVCAELGKQKIVCPNLEVLIDLFETMFYASLRTEELARISFDIVYLDPRTPDPIPPSGSTENNSMVVQLAEPVPLNIPNLIKIAAASDPRTSSFAVYHDETDELFIWGLVDQGNTYTNYVNYESETEIARPGLFQATIAGVGHIVASIEMKKIAELKVNALLTSVLDVLEGGPIREALMPGINSYLNAVYKSLPEAQYKAGSDWNERLTSNWFETLYRLLLRVQKYGHGGAILITPDNTSLGLSVKYELPYDRLRASLENEASARVSATYFYKQIWKDYLDKGADQIPVDLYLQESSARERHDRSRRELEGAIWFVSLLTRADGLVLLNQNLELHGFGVEITLSGESPIILISGDRDATEDQLIKIDFNHYGTRHRSMMRYCAIVPGSVGFVVSQDGDVRAMTQVRGQLVMWENIKLQQPQFIRYEGSALGSVEMTE